MYVAVKGGEAAIEAAHQLLAATRRGNPDVPELSARKSASSSHSLSIG
jgi:alpha-D-ribose 1-methylphosphonate 5-triphosphate synthase subunit PhnI